jgi:hypothetical protein
VLPYSAVYFFELIDFAELIHDNEPKNLELEASAIVYRYARRDTPRAKALYSPFISQYRKESAL